MGRTKGRTTGRSCVRTSSREQLIFASVLNLPSESGLLFWHILALVPRKSFWVFSHVFTPIDLDRFCLPPRLRGSQCGSSASGVRGQSSCRCLSPGLTPTSHHWRGSGLLAPGLLNPSPVWQRGPRFLASRCSRWQFFGWLAPLAFESFYEGKIDVIDVGVEDHSRNGAGVCSSFSTTFHESIIILSCCTGPQLTPVDSRCLQVRSCGLERTSQVFVNEAYVHRIDSMSQARTSRIIL